MINLGESNIDNHQKVAIMRKGTLFAICGLAAFSGSVCYGQQFNGPALYDAVGNVKSIKVSPSPLFAASKVEFMKDGHIKDSTLTFDWDGKAIGKDMRVYKMMQNVDLEYNTDDKLVVASVDSSTGLLGGFNASISYGGEHPDKLVVTETKGKNPCVYTYSFANYALDDAGNWVSRDVELTVTDLKDNSVKENKQFTETRKIEYYE